MRWSLLPLLLSVLLPLDVSALPARPQEPGQGESLLGTWDGSYEPAGIVGADPCSLLVAADEAGGLRAELVLPGERHALGGAFEAASGLLRLAGPDGQGALELHLVEETLVGQGHEGTWVSGFHLRRTSADWLERDHSLRVVELASKERPEDFARIGLASETGLRLDELVRALAERQRLVGLSIACVVDGRVVDVRSLGWEDFFADVPAGAETRYRWASISKPLTATTALRLAAAGRFDLDGDVRSWVPEYPDQGVRITPRLILCHQSGIVHYAGAVRTWREYDEPHPFEHLVNGLDLFRESPLLAAPGERYSYSTHAYTLLGLALERAGERPFAELVRAQVLEPLGMRTTEPDFPSRDVPHRTRGYHHEGERVLETLDDDVSWKLPGGGWTSTVEDLARFGAGLLGSELLDEVQKTAAWTRQPLADGTPTEAGLGFFLGELKGERLVSHSGGQRCTSTYLALLPERGLAVAVMCNTAGTPMSELALPALGLLLEQDG